MVTQWDTALTPVTTNDGKKDGIRVALPMPLSRSLLSRGYTRATVRVTAEGILLIPYTGATRLAEEVDLPAWEEVSA